MIHSINIVYTVNHLCLVPTNLFGYKLSTKILYFLGKVEGEQPGRKGASVVKALVKTIPDPEDHAVTTDNFFGDYTLLSELADMGVAATSTVRENRLHDAPLQKKTILKKKERGSIEYCSDGVVTTCSWVDNKPVFVISNHIGVNPTQPKQRFSQKEKKYIQVQCPNMIVNYNDTMGGVDQFDSALADYRPHIRGVKWYYPFFTHSLNVLVAASWRLSRILGNKMDHLEFRRSIVTCMLKSRKSEEIMTVRHVLGDVRFDGVGHLSSKGEKEGRCKECMKNTYFVCVKCKVRLHKKCHLDYHTLV